MHFHLVAIQFHMLVIFDTCRPIVVKNIERNSLKNIIAEFLAENCDGTSVERLSPAHPLGFVGDASGWMQGHHLVVTDLGGQDEPQEAASKHPLTMKKKIGIIHLTIRYK